VHSSRWLRARNGFACTRADKEDRRLLEQSARFGEQEQVSVRRA
jgi:hypothetical protein